MITRLKIKKKIFYKNREIIDLYKKHHFSSNLHFFIKK